METGKKLWVFADGDLPPQGNEEPLGHEALMVLNTSDSPAELSLNYYYEDKDPKIGVKLIVPAKRVNCFRLDYPVGEEKFLNTPGQYSLVVNSNVPVVAVFGRLDRRKDMAYYPVQGFSL